ncbi:MAG: FtsX-like permease family protein [Cytophagales bacterium]|nr:FtsX-like permease family protein [Cytophagales bacterium]
MAGAIEHTCCLLRTFRFGHLSVERKTKELGIRKILGAEPFSLFLMVSLSFTKNVLLAFVLACPIAWYIMREWLSAFEYKIQLSPSSFILTGIVVLLLVLITVSYQSIKAASHNPINSLKQE